MTSSVNSCAGLSPLEGDSSFIFTDEDAAFFGPFYRPFETTNYQSLKRNIVVHSTQARARCSMTLAALINGRVHIR